jgi:hypothetical protein
MADQSYQNHAQLVKPFHFFLLPVSFLTLIGAFINLYRAWDHGTGRLSAALIASMALLIVMAATFGRIFALKAQDRLIRSEESFRHYLLTGKPLDPRITVDQAIGLRFAPDEEFLPLCERAARESLSRKDIKQNIKTWRVDPYRV